MSIASDVINENTKLTSIRDSLRELLTQHGIVYYDATMKADQIKTQMVYKVVEVVSKGVTQGVMDNVKSN